MFFSFIFIQSLLIYRKSENAKKYLADHPEVFEEIDRKVRVRFGLIDADEEAEVSTPEKTGKITENIEEVTLELDDAIEIEE